MELCGGYVDFIIRFITDATEPTLPLKSKIMICLHGEKTKIRPLEQRSQFQKNTVGLQFFIDKQPRTGIEVKQPVEAVAGRTV